MSCAERSSETPAAHLRHHQVGKKEIDRSAAIFAEQALRVIAIGRFDHFITEAAKHAHGNMSNTNVVFENENGFGAAARFLASYFFICGRRRRRHARKIDLHGRAFSLLAFNAQMSAALMNNAVTSCEAESASLLIGFGGEQWVEEMRFRLLAHSNSGIRDVNQNILAGNKVATVERRFF